MARFLYKIEYLLGQPNLVFNKNDVILRIIISGVVFYLSLILLMNVFGKRSISNLSMYDYVTTLAMGSIVSSAIILKEITILDGLSGVLVLLFLQFCVTFLTARQPKLFDILNPNPKVVFLEGKFILDNMKKNRITKNEVLSAIRIQGQTSSDQIFAVVLETNGVLSVIKSVSEDKREEITRFL